MLAHAAMTAMLDRHPLQGLTCVYTVALVRQHLLVVASALSVLLEHLLEKAPQSATNVQKGTKMLTQTQPQFVHQFFVI